MAEFPVHTVNRPAVLRGRTNGKLPGSILVEVPGQAGGPRVALVAPASRAWIALTAAAKAAGFVLKSTSLADSYRPFTVQEHLFRQRYTTAVLAGRPSKVWKGQRWFLRHGVATAAVPGTSNHGLGLAVDTGEERDPRTGTESLSHAALRWLVRNEESFGFSHELQEEPWHIRYFAGDEVPAAVVVFEGGAHDGGDGHRMGGGDGDSGEDDDVTPEQFLTILQDPAVARAMRALSWQYQDVGDKSAHDIVLGEYRSTLQRLHEATEEIRSKIAVGPVLATMTPEAIAGLILASLSADTARAVATTLAAGLVAVPAPAVPVPAPPVDDHVI
jgi:LAS superfamily LD-carboxypeptidase LdcB